MNLAVPKDKTIRKVLAKLCRIFGETNFYLVDYWDADLCAIGVKNLTDKKHLIYISTNNKPTDYYFVEVEKINSETDLENYDVIGDFDEITFEELSKLITKYLYLQPNL